MYKKNFLLITLLILIIINHSHCNAAGISHYTQLLTNKMKVISNLDTRLRETHNDIEKLGHKQIDQKINGNDEINEKLTEVRALKKQIISMTPKLVLAAGKFDPTGLRDSLKILNLTESILEETKKILLDVKKSLVNTTNTLNPVTDRYKIYNKIGIAHSKLDSTLQDLKIFEGALQ